MQGIYAIRNKVNGKRYIGSTNNFRRRWGMHEYALKKGNHYNGHLQRAWNKYGKESFVFEIVEEVEGNNRALLDHEQAYLDKEFVTGTLYNIALDVVSATRGRKLGAYSESRRNKISLSISKYYETHDHPWLGRHHTEETKQKLRKAKEGHVPWNKGGGEYLSRETRLGIIEQQAGPYPAFYNVKTGECIPAGKNLRRMCRERGLCSVVMRYVKTGTTNQTRDGWMLAGTRKNES